MKPLNALCILSLLLASRIRADDDIKQFIQKAKQLPAPTATPTAVNTPNQASFVPKEFEGTYQGIRWSYGQPDLPVMTTAEIHDDKLKKTDVLVASPLTKVYWRTKASVSTVLFPPDFKPVVNEYNLKDFRLMSAKEVADWTALESEWRTPLSRTIGLARGRPGSVEEVLLFSRNPQKGELGLDILVPGVRDAWGGYRLFSPEQLSRGDCDSRLEGCKKS